MRVLVTGASGFIGGVLCAELLERGHDVGALVRRPGSQPPGTRALAGDLGDGEDLAGLVAEGRPDWVVHLAAEIASQRSARKLHEVNVGGTERLLDGIVDTTMLVCLGSKEARRHHRRERQRHQG